MKYVYVDQPCGEPIWIRGFGFDPHPRKFNQLQGRDFYVIHYILSGSGEFNGSVVNANQLFIIRPGCPADYKTNRDDPWSYFWVCFNGEGIEKLLNRIGITDDRSVFDCSYLSNIQSSIAELMLHDGRSISNLLALSYFYRFIWYHEEQVNAPDKPIPEHIQRAVDYIHDNYFKQIRITDVSNFLGLDNQYLYNLFSRHMGVSPKEYLNRVRIDRACTLLLDSNASIGEIASAIGYPDGFTFSRFFRTRTGLSPTEYRNTPHKKK